MVTLSHAQTLCVALLDLSGWVKMSALIIISGA